MVLLGHKVHIIKLEGPSFQFSFTPGTPKNVVGYSIVVLLSLCEILFCPKTQILSLRDIKILLS